MKDNDMFEGAERFTKMWTEFATNMAKQSTVYNADESAAEMGRGMRDAWFKAMSEYCEESMRSPEFLKSMKDSMDQSIAFRKQMNDFLGRMNHEFQFSTRQDADTLMAGILEIENLVRTGLARLEKQLGTMQQQLDALESNRGEQGPEPRPASSIPTPRKVAPKKTATKLSRKGKTEVPSKRKKAK